MSASEASGRPAPGGTALLSAAGIVSALFFLSFWGTNAEGLGAHDLGLALAFSFAVPVTLYVSLALAVLALVAAAVSHRRGGHAGRYVAALAVALLPVAFLFVVDLV